MGWNENTTAEALPNVFKAANNLGNTFKLFFSLDYAGNGAWPQDEVITLINAYRNNDAYFKHNGQPLVSTFEGPANASDWNTIKTATNDFFIPSYSSLGAKHAMKTGVVDGLFNGVRDRKDPTTITTRSTSRLGLRARPAARVRADHPVERG
jgi:hypothetical protein